MGTDSTLVTGSGNTIDTRRYDSSFNARGADLSDATIIIKRGNKNEDKVMVQRP